MNILNPVEVPKFASPKQAIRTALGKIGYQDLMQTMEPDLIEWAIEASDMISKPKTFKIYEDDFVVCGNKIQLDSSVLLVECASVNGQPMEYITNKGCCSRLTRNSLNRCCKSNQKFYLDECYMHFKPTLPDGTVVHVEYLQRAYGADGYPMIIDSCNMAISEYICMLVCVRHGDNRAAFWNEKWEKHCPQARANLNRITQGQIDNLAYVYYSNPAGHASFGGIGYWSALNVW